MKNILLTLFISALFTLPVTAQNVAGNRIPKEVNTAFKTKFPAATNIAWQKNNKVNFRASFRSNGCDKNAIFDGNGNWVETITSINEQGLPTSIRFALKKQYNGYAVAKTLRMESPNQEVTFKTELKKGNQKTNVVFTSTGKVINYDDSSFAGL